MSVFDLGLAWPKKTIHIENLFLVVAIVYITVATYLGFRFVDCLSPEKIKAAIGFVLIIPAVILGLIAYLKWFMAFEKHTLEKEKEQKKE